MGTAQRLVQAGAQRQVQGQRQALAMTPQLTQSIALLAMPAVELEAYLAERAAANPLLAVRPAPRGTFPASATAPARTPDAFAFVAQERTLAAHLCEQIARAAARAPVAAAARAIAHDLSPEGRASDTDWLVADGHRPADVEAALALVRTLEPAGVGARDLAHCLALQLAARDRLDPAMRAVVANLPLVARGDRAGLMRASGLDDVELDDALAELRRLDPRPGLAFRREPDVVLPPDILMARDARGGWRVELNAETLPRALVDHATHARTLRSARTAAERAWLAEALHDATWLVRALDQRARTMLKVAEALVAAQDAFFEHGARALKPLTMNAIAERIAMHESTVSRVAAAKTICGPWGTAPLRFFFSPAIPGTDGGEHSAVAVQSRIAELVRHEGAEVLSDDAIVSRLRGDGVAIARRTVAKYRERLAIPSSLERRRGVRPVPRRAVLVAAAAPV